MQTYKGWAYVLLTSVLLFLMLRNHIERLRKAERKAKDSDNLKTAFIQNISHEIRTPINSTIGFSELSKEEGIDEKAKDEYLGYISASSAQLLYTINEVMDILLIETGNKKVIAEKVSLNELVDDVYNTFFPVILPEIPIVAQSSFTMINEKDKTLRAGCTDYLSKPYERSQMLEIISRHVSVWQL